MTVPQQAAGYAEANQQFVQATSFCSLHWADDMDSDEADGGDDAPPGWEDVDVKGKEAVPRQRTEQRAL